jgi:hypothetical protein
MSYTSTFYSGACVVSSPQAIYIYGYQTNNWLILRPQ